ncbi:hypothetical protein [Bradyrhizobium sp. Tv2a-2]|nr:hypothetical protein [Bradyrhizobium sp. Tv2a-2]
MRAPVAAYGLVILIRRSGPDVSVLASLSLPIAPNPDVFRATAIPVSGLI